MGFLGVGGYGVCMMGGKGTKEGIGSCEISLRTWNLGWW